MAKAYLSIFSKPTDRKRVSPANKIVPTPPAKWHRNHGCVAEPANTRVVDESSGDGDTESEDIEGPIDDIDEDKAEYENGTVKASVSVAFSEIEKMFGITISASDQQMAQQVLPKISGLANRAKNSPVVQHKFESY
ncbi:hypothetical protein FRC11_001272, partial [Ceratobasidium sp. 423]